MAANLNKPPRLRIFPNLEALSQAAADRFVEVLGERCMPGHRCSVALSGGSTPRLFYSLLATAAYRNRVDWTCLHVFWTDERCVAPTDNESNYKMAYDLLLSAVPLPANNLHRVQGEDGPGEAANQYAAEIQAFFGSRRLPAFDLVILGAGVDGHTASLFPGTAALQEQTRPAIPVILQPPRISRVTLTLPVLSNAAHVLVLAAGGSKADVVHEIFEQGNEKQHPVGMVRTVNGTLEWFIDREAAGRSTR